MGKNIKWLVLAFGLVMALASAVKAGTQNDGTRLHGHLDFASADTATISSTDYQQVPVALNGRRTIFVCPILSSSTSTSCTVGIALGTYDAVSGAWTPEGWAEAAFVVSSNLTWSTGLAPTKGVELSAGGHTHFKLYLPQLSNGSAKVYWSAY